jgi:HEAT repeat protein
VALEQPDQHPAVRLAAARTLIELDARETAPQLLRQAQSGGDGLRELVEPALARWNYEPARAVWLERIARPERDRGSLLLAIRGLATVREEKAIAGLRDLVITPTTPAPARLAAARALAVVRTAGFEADARRLLTESDPVAHLAAAALLRHHAGDEAVGLLQALARNAEPTVVATALTRLLEIDPKLVISERDQLLANQDAEVRSLVVRAMIRQPSEEHLRLLGDRLDDLHPQVRTLARQGLRELAARPEFTDSINQQGMRLLAAPGWRGQEQAAILLAQLGYKPAAGRLVELLSSGRAEVFVAAAWGLRQLAVADTLPAAHKFVQSPHWGVPMPGGPRGAPMVPANAADEQLSQLAQFLGQERYKPADAALRRLIPREPGLLTSRALPLAGPEARSAAIWALGRIHEGTPVPELVPALEGRLNDVNNPLGDEAPHVRRMSAVALGRMKASGALDTLQSHWSGKLTLDLVNNACGWAIAQIKGEVLPPPGTVEIRARDGFLSPLEPPRP